MSDQAEIVDFRGFEADMVMKQAALEGAFAVLAAALSAAGLVDGQWLADTLRAMSANMPAAAKLVVEDIARSIAVLGQASGKLTLRVVD